MLVPLEPTRAASSLDLLGVALLAQRPARRQRGCIVAGQDAGAERTAEHSTAIDAEHPAEGLIDERETAVRVAAQDEVRLVVQKIAVAGLVLAHLPLDVLQRFEPALEALADGHEALELAGQISGTIRTGLGVGREAKNGWQFQTLQPGAQAPR